MRVSILAAVAVVAAVAIPAQAHAARGLAGVVVAKQRGTLVVTGARGAGTTVRVAAARARVGDRVAIRGRQLRDGTLQASAVTVRSHTRNAIVRGVVMRHVRRTAFLAVGRSVIALHHAPTTTPTGTIVSATVRIDDHGDLDEIDTHAAAQGANVEIEGRIVSLSPFVVSLEGLPITITVPASMTLPPGLAAGDEIELTVQVAANNVFTLVSIDDENEQQQADEVEVKGSVFSSTATELVVVSHGTKFTFAAPAGKTLPVIPTGTFVEAKGVMVNGVLTLVRVKVENDDGDDGGGDDGGGHGGH